MNQAENLLNTFRAKGLKFAAAESCTGGMIMAALTDIAGSSDVVERGFVTYSNAAKEQMLGVHKSTLEIFGAVSEEVAREMAEGALRNSMADASISVTGVAGPGASEAKPEGLVCFGLARTGKKSVSRRYEFGALGRANIRQKSVETAICLIMSYLEET